MLDFGGWGYVGGGRVVTWSSAEGGVGTDDLVEEDDGAAGCGEPGQQCLGEVALGEGGQCSDRRTTQHTHQKDQSSSDAEKRRRSSLGQLMLPEGLAGFTRGGLMQNL